MIVLIVGGDVMRPGLAMNARIMHALRNYNNKQRTYSLNT